MAKYQTEDKLHQGYRVKSLIYKTQEVEVMVEWLKANDPYLYLYCKFIAYSFLRVNEIRHIKIRDIDLVNWRITRTGENHKTGKRTYQYIQNIFRADLQALELHKYEPDMYLFSKNQQPGYHLLNEKYFCMRFRKYKDLHGFGRNHTMYGLKHTFISQMKRQGATDKELLNITGLVTIEALYKYLKDIGAVEPADMSDKYLVKF